MSIAESNANYIFKCDKQLHYVAEKLATLYRGGELCDTTLIADDDNIEVKAHRLVLYLSSEYFRPVFDNGLEQHTPAVIRINNVDGDTLKKIIGFMYTFEIEMSKESIEKVLSAAALFQMKTLREGCCNVMAEQLNAINCLKFVQLAAQHSCTNLYEKSLNCAYKNFEEVSNGEEFLKLTEPQLSKFLSQDGVNVVSQETLFLSLIKWLKYDQETREESIYILLNDFVRFAELEPKFILKNAALVAHIAKCSKLLFSWLDWHSSNEMPKKQVNQEIVLSQETPKKVKINYYYNKDDVFRIDSYDPELNKWTAKDWPQPLKIRSDYAMAFKQNEFFIAGGMIGNDFTNSVECLDLKSLKWRYLPPMITARSDFVLQVWNGSLFVVGGRNKTGWLRLVEKYDFNDGKWTALAELPAVFIIVGRVIFGGKLYVSVFKTGHLKCYDPATNKWSETADSNKKTACMLVTANEKYIYAVGEDEHSFESGTVERYNPANNTWKVMTSMSPKSWLTDCIIGDNKLFVCRKNNFDQSRHIEEYNEKTNEWKILAQFLKPSTDRTCHCFVEYE